MAIKHLPAILQFFSIAYSHVVAKFTSPAATKKPCTADELTLKSSKTKWPQVGHLPFSHSPVSFVTGYVSAFAHICLLSTLRYGLPISFTYLKHTASFRKLGLLNFFN